MVRSASIGGLALSCVMVVACGAKTGLDAPDIAFAQDAALDGLVDVTSDAPERCIEAPLEDADVAPVVLDLAIQARVGAADVLFVMDRTGSMSEEIDNIRQSLRTVIVPGLVRAIPDLQLGLVSFGDFPVTPFGSQEDRPFTLERPMGREFTALQGALTSLRAGGGGDNPEALTEALYQVATGEGLRAGRPGQEFWIEPAAGCRVPGVGYPCFRTRATPIVVVVTDAPTHNGPRPESNYTAGSFIPSAALPHTYAQAVDAMRRTLHGRMIGINSGVGLSTARPDLESFANDLGSLGSDGQPLVFDINPDGTGLSEQVVSSVTRLINEVRLSVSARAVDLDGSGAAAFVRAIVPRTAAPMSNVQRVTASAFEGVVPGTTLRFDLVLDRGRIPRRAETVRYVIRIEYLEDERVVLSAQDIAIVVPGTGAPRCPNDQ
ncbi:MAG: vWA domain-containing protein [Deltaproteobacteria bacterium]|nr:vWA domain-containing protein [Deltaproteobacteria bacterium]